MTCLVSGTGRVVNEPQLRNAGGYDVLNFRLAMENGFGDKKTTTFFNCAIWGKRASSMTNILEKGQLIVIHGAELSTREYEHNGQSKQSFELRLDKIDLLPRASATDSDDRRTAPIAQTSRSQAHAATGRAAVTDDLDDEVPF